MKDTWDVIKIAKLGKYKYGDGLDEKEIAYALNKLGFNISIYLGISEIEFNKYLINPLEIVLKHIPKKYHKYIQGKIYTDGIDNPTKYELSDTSIFKKISHLYIFLY